MTRDPFTGLTWCGGDCTSCDECKACMDPPPARVDPADVLQSPSRDDEGRPL